MDIAILPRETIYLKELRNECVYYKLMGQLEIVDTRLEQYRSLGPAFQTIYSTIQIEMTG